MIWIVPLAALTLFGLTCWRCRISECRLPPTEPYSQTVHSCEVLLGSIEREKSQLQSRLAMLDELIEKSDRVIEQAAEQIARVHALRDDSPDLTEREMLRSLCENGYPTSEIAKLTGRDPHQIRKAA